MNVNPIFTDSRGRRIAPPKSPSSMARRARRQGVFGTLALLLAAFVTMGAITQFDLAHQVKGTLPTGNGGTGTASTLTGIVRGGSAYTAAELSGDCATSGSNTACNDTTHSFTVAAGDVVQIKSGTTASSSETLANVTASMELWN
jgi:hypothetical protein